MSQVLSSPLRNEIAQAQQVFNHPVPVNLSHDEHVSPHHFGSLLELQPASPVRLPSITMSTTATSSGLSVPNSKAVRGKGKPKVVPNSNTISSMEFG